MLRKTALNAVHRQMGAKMVDFGGWEMPIEYPSSPMGPGGLMREHLAVRTGVGIFDVSHMGDISITGPEALVAVQHISMNDASRLAVDPRAVVNPPATQPVVVSPPQPRAPTTTHVIYVHDDGEVEVRP